MIHHANIEKPERCFVRLYKLYNSLCPSDRPDNAYYLKPLQKPLPGCWYSSQPIGHTKLGTTINKMCQNGGILGYRTNHSLRATAATRLHQSGCIDKQRIMERTGHRSVEAVRSYKRASKHQQEQVSDILNNGCIVSATNQNGLIVMISILKILLHKWIPNLYMVHCLWNIHLPVLLCSIYHLAHLSLSTMLEINETFIMTLLLFKL